MFSFIKNTFTINILAVIFTASLAGCAPQSGGLSNSHKNTAATPEKAELFRTWKMDGCRIQAENNHVKISTDGNQSHQTLRMKVKLPQPPQRPPLISILGIGGLDLNQTGRGVNWSFELPNTAYAAAQMMAGRAYIVIEYTPMPTTRLPAPVSVTATFSLQELPKAILALYKKCEAN